MDCIDISIRLMLGRRKNVISSRWIIFLGAKGKLLAKHNGLIVKGREREREREREFNESDFLKSISGRFEPATAA